MRRQNFWQKYKQTVIVWSSLAAILALWVYFAPSGLRQYLEVRSKVQSLSTEIDALRQQNEALRAEIDRIKTDPRHLEKIAREQGFLKKNEFVFDFEPPPPGK